MKLSIAATYPSPPEQFFFPSLAKSNLKLLPVRNVWVAGKEKVKDNAVLEPFLSGVRSSRKCNTSESQVLRGKLNQSSGRNNKFFFVLTLRVSL